MSVFKIGDKVIIKSTIGRENDVQQVVCFGKEYTDFGKHYCEYYSLSGNPNVRYHESCLELWNPKKDLEGGYKMKEFEIGKTYKTENGCDAQLLHVNAFGQFEGVLKYDGKQGVLTTWDKNGYCISGLDVKNEYKLVREVEMKEISMDKKYMIGTGQKVKIVAIEDDSDFPVIGRIESYVGLWSINGRHKTDTNLNLIEVNPYADFKIDDKVIVWNDGVGIKCRGYFAGVGVSHGRTLIWDDGQTSWSTKSDYCYTTSYDNCVKWDGTDD